MPNADSAASVQPRNTLAALYLLLLLAVAAGYFTYLLQHSINVPLADDIFDVLLPLSEVREAPDLSIAFDALYRQHTDHRTVASRLVYSAILWLDGEIDFRVLNVLANLALPLLLYILYLLTAGAGQRLLLLLPAACFLLQLRAYGITFWAMASFAYFYVFLYGFIALLLLHRATTLRLCLAILVATLACFTLASGLMIWLVGLASLLQQALVRRAIPLRYLLYWVLAAVVVVVLWRTGLADRAPLGLLLHNVINDPGHHLLYALTLLGSAFSERSVGIAASAGAGMLIVLTVSTVLRWRKEDLRLELCSWFIVLSVLVMVLGRGFATVDYGLSSRYSFPSTLMLATTWVLVAVRLRIGNTALLLVAVVLALWYWGHSMVVYSRALQPHMEQRVKDFNRGHYRAWPYPPREGRRIVERAIELGIYTPPPKPLPPAAVSLKVGQGG